MMQDAQEEPTFQQKAETISKFSARTMRIFLSWGTGLQLLNETKDALHGHHHFAGAFYSLYKEERQPQLGKIEQRYYVENRLQLKHLQLLSCRKRCPETLAANTKITHFCADRAFTSPH